MSFLLSVFGENDNEHLATYAVIKRVAEYSEKELVELADNNKYGRAFVLTDEPEPRMVAFTYMWNGFRYIEKYFNNPQTLIRTKIIK